jgi:hypothetical protein
MSDTQFTKLDWRPGKRRRTQPRVQAYGGKDRAGRFLVAAKFVGLHTDRAARCTATARSTGRKCCRVAVAGANVCMVQGGARVLKSTRPYVATKHGQRIMAEHALRTNGGAQTCDLRYFGTPTSVGRRQRQLPNSPFLGLVSACRLVARSHQAFAKGAWT